MSDMLEQISCKFFCLLLHTWTDISIFLGGCVLDGPVDFIAIKHGKNRAGARSSILMHSRVRTKIEDVSLSV